ncbi:MAG: PfkB family carbohydrate kinase [Endomicrobia bacterium]|nr:PfkB family carbohydrate kinase [Endomicrobiia bacterium]
MRILAMTCCCVDLFPETGKILPGGNSLNLAVSCKKAGAENVYVMGNIGKDGYGEIVKKAADKYGINRAGIREIEGQTANHMIHIDEKGDRYFKENSWIGGVWADWRINADDEKFMKSMDAVVTTIGEPEFKNIIKIKRDAPFLLSVDFHDENINPEWEEYFDAVDLFFISGKNQNPKKLEEWSKNFNAVFTATLGEFGSVSFKDGLKYECNAAKVGKVIDTTGCGDSYQGGFIVEYLKSKNIENAMRKGSESAAETLSYIGGFEI